MYIMVWNLAEDLKYGKYHEKKLASWFNRNKYFQDPIKLYQNEKSQVDFRNNEIIAELKTRPNCTHTRYDETFFGYNKIQHYKNLNDSRPLIFYFLFTDGLYSWEYKEGEYQVRDYYHRERGMIDQVYVPHTNLKLVSTDITSKSTLPPDYQEYL